MVPVVWWLCSTAGKVTVCQASHWLCITQRCPWVGLTYGLRWVINGSEISVFTGLGWVMNLKWQMCEKCKSCNFASSIDRRIRFAVWCVILTAGQLLFDMGVQFVMGWLGSGQIYSTLGWAGSMEKTHEQLWHHRPRLFSLTLKQGMITRVYRACR